MRVASERPGTNVERRCVVDGYVTYHAVALNESSWSSGHGVYAGEQQYYCNNVTFAIVHDQRRRGGEGNRKTKHLLADWTNGPRELRSFRHFFRVKFVRPHRKRAYDVFTTRSLPKTKYYRSQSSSVPRTCSSFRTAENAYGETAARRVTVAGVLARVLRFRMCFAYCSLIIVINKYLVVRYVVEPSLK